MRHPQHGTIILLAVIGGTLIASALAQDAPLRRIAEVACIGGAPAPCVTVATSASDIAGLWHQAQEAHGYLRYNADGTFWISPTFEDAAAPTAGSPRGTVSFDGEVMTIELDAHPVPECLTARYVVGVLRYGDPVALVYMPVHDDCEARRVNFTVPLVWVGDGGARAEVHAPATRLHAAWTRPHPAHGSVAPD
jgi:hypothetical protein